MDVPVTKSDVESVQEEITRAVDEQNGWELDLPNPNHATDPEEFSVLHLYKNGGNDGQVDVLVNENTGVFDAYIYELPDHSSMYRYESVEGLIEGIEEFFAE